jgi:hypothetical protein
VVGAGAGEVVADPGAEVLFGLGESDVAVAGDFGEGGADVECFVSALDGAGDHCGVLSGVWGQGWGGR